MSYAYATKDQMKVWKSALKPEKDGDQPPATKVQFVVTKDDTGYRAHLIATDYHQCVKRAIELEDVTEVMKTSIPREAVEQAEKAMKAGDRAHFEDGKIVVKEILEEDEMFSDLERTKAIIPYAEQMDLLPDLDTALANVANTGQPDAIVTINSTLLKRVAEQLKDGDNAIYVDLHLRAGQKGLVFKAFNDVEGKEITAVIMPINTEHLTQ